MFSTAIKEWGIGLPSNPVQNIRRPAPPPGRERRLSLEEETRLMQAVDAHSNPMLGWIVRIALETGMRSSEIRTLRRSQVDLKRRIVRLLETKNTLPRTVPLTSASVDIFRQALANPVRPIDTDLIFFGEPGKDGQRRPYNFIFTGFFRWLLVNGPAFTNSIIQSLARIGEQAAGVSSVTPSGIVDVGFMIWKQAINNLSAWSPVDSLVGAVLSAAIMLLLALVAINMLLMLIAAWLLAYAGIFFLGFGGSRWTSDMAINYSKTVLGVAAQIMTMVLLVGIGNDMLSTFYPE